MHRVVLAEVGLHALKETQQVEEKSARSVVLDLEGDAELGSIVGTCGGR